MALSNELVIDLTPDFPPDGLAPAEGLQAGAREGPDLLRWQWSQLLLSGFAERVIEAGRKVPASWYAGVGLVPWSGADLVLDVPGRIEEAARESGYVWGGLILTSNPIPPGPYEDDNTLWLGGSRFPIVVRHARYRPEAREVSESGTLLGTAAAWARATPAHPVCPGTEGLLTAAHVVGAGLGSYDIESGGTWEGTASVEEFAPPCVDAAFLRLAWTPPAPAPLVPAAAIAIAFGDPADFDGATTGAVTGHVTHVSAHARYSGSGVPMILCHDGLGAGGDSGALVEVRGTPAAMHLGKIELDHGAGFESRGILLRQVAHVMHLDFFGQGRRAWRRRRSRRLRRRQGRKPRSI